MPDKPPFFLKFCMTLALVIMAFLLMALIGEM